MEHISTFFNYFLHLDEYLQLFISQYPQWTLVLLFAIVFCETGLVIFPLLPGDSLLFAAGSLAAVGHMNINILALTLASAAILGDTVNYSIGHWVGPKIFKKESSWLFNKKHLDRAQLFYEKYGGKAIIIARFVPIIRTFAPFVAGIGKMKYRLFLTYNVLGALLWVGSFIYISYFFGNIPLVKKNFSLIVLAIIFISLIPPVIEYLRHRSSKKVKP